MDDHLDEDGQGGDAAKPGHKGPREAGVDIVTEVLRHSRAFAGVVDCRICISTCLRAQIGAQSLQIRQPQTVRQFEAGGTNTSSVSLLFSRKMALYVCLDMAQKGSPTTRASDHP